MPSPRLPRFLLETALVCLLVCSGLAARGLNGPDFSPDGRRVAIVSGGLRIVDLQTGGAKTVNTGQPGPGPAAGTVLWSPDGTRLLCAGVGQQGALPASLYDDVTGKAARLAGAGQGPFAWREDSLRFLSFAYGEDGAAAVQYDVKDHGVALRTRFPGSPMAALWLPGTDDVAVLAAAKHGGGADIYTIEAGEVHRITKTADVIGFTLTPDKQSLVWVRRGPNPRYILLSLYAMGLKERSVARLAFPDRVPGINPDSRHAPVDVVGAAIAPDGSRLAVGVRMQATAAPGSGAQRSAPALYMVSRDGASCRLLHRAPASSADTQPLLSSWSRDGKQLAVESLVPGDVLLRLYAADGGRERVVLDR